jgi:zinc transporter, ZIP family
VKRLVLSLLVVGLIVVGGPVVLAFGPPWHGHSGAEDEELTVERSTLSSGRIVLTVRGVATEPVRVAQVLVDDAFVGFRMPVAAVRPHQVTRLTILYPWLRGEVYEIDLLTSTGAMVEYELEDAEAS